MTPKPTVTKPAQGKADNSVLTGQVYSNQQEQLPSRQHTRSSPQRVKPIREQMDLIEKLRRQNKGQEESSAPSRGSVLPLNNRKTELSHAVISTSYAQRMSGEVTSFKHLLNTHTKTRAMVDAIKRLGKGKEEQETVPIPALANKSTTDNETTTTTSNPITTNKCETAALQVWDELFGEDEISKIIEQSNYIQVEVA